VVDEATDDGTISGYTIAQHQGYVQSGVSELTADVDVSSATYERLQNLDVHVLCRIVYWRISLLVPHVKISWLVPIPILLNIRHLILFCCGQQVLLQHAELAGGRLRLSFA
jgi:hypothetical protein